MATVQTTNNHESNREPTHCKESDFSNNQSTTSPTAGDKKAPWCFSTWAISGHRVDAYAYSTNPFAASATECWALCQATSGCIATTWFYTPSVTGYASGDALYSAPWKVILPQQGRGGSNNKQPLAAVTCLGSLRHASSKPST